jgi:ribose 5-phosphate isomerase B
MKISLGADHAGFHLKEALKRKLTADGHQITDHGSDSDQSCDYPVFAAAVGHDVAHGIADRGILVCGTGVGMSIAANKIDGIRAAVGASDEVVRLTREHNDLNVLTLGARIVEAPAAEHLVDTFLQTEFLGGRHAKRVALITGLEHNENGEK